MIHPGVGMCRPAGSHGSPFEVYLVVSQNVGTPQYYSPYYTNSKIVPLTLENPV